ncbi:MAG: hypothetical protein H6Q43_2609 [Deltaproteobacteria bacterium]|nr:hypothetical protein [Deltaproteobacteria bacterium]
MFPFLTKQNERLFGGGIDLTAPIFFIFHLTEIEFQYLCVLLDFCGEYSCGEVPWSKKFEF